MKISIKMRGKILVVILSLTCASCEERVPKTAAPPAPSSPTPGSSDPRPGEWGSPHFDVCALLPKGEIETVQHAVVKDVQGGGRPDGHFLISQCVYTTEPPSESVVVSISESNPDYALRLTPKQSWDLTLSRYAKRGAEGGKKFMPPRKIEGVGEEAYWMGGAIYVLQKKFTLRISVGGPGSEEEKVQSCKILAQSALSRLPP